MLGTAQNFIPVALGIGAAAAIAIVAALTAASGLWVLTDMPNDQPQGRRSSIDRRDPTHEALITELREAGR